MLLSKKGMDDFIQQKIIYLIIILLACAIIYFIIKNIISQVLAI